MKQNYFKKNNLLKLLVFAMVVFSFNTYAQTITTTYSFTGAMQTYTVPSCVTQITIDARGAEGGDAIGTTTGWGAGPVNLTGGNGGRVLTVITVTPGEVLNIFIGGKGTTLAGGFNGGGNPGPACSGTEVKWAGGGGASDIRRSGAALANRIVVAGGGGGAAGAFNTYYSIDNTGAGGGLTGANTTNFGGVVCVNPTGGSQVAGGIGGNNSCWCSLLNVAGSGSLGLGGNSICAPSGLSTCACGGTGCTSGGGGGGGYYGGGGGICFTAGAGGSSYTLPSAISVTHTQGFQTGNGSITITEVNLPPCVGTPTVGTAIASPSTACATYTTALSLSGAVTQCSLNYQWQSAPAPGGPFTAIPGATLMLANFNNTVTTYYRCLVACGGSTAVSTTATAQIVPCGAGTPTAGTAVANPTTACLSGTITLSLSGNVPSCGLNYQWQVAPALAGPYANIGGAITQTVSLTTTVTSYYRCQVSCGANTVFSNPATVSITPGPCQICTGQYYVRSNSGEPWGFTNNPVSMNAVFGGTWTSAFFQTVNVVAMLQPTTAFVYLEGGDANALAMNTFVTTNIVALQNWVAAGGRLFMNAAPNQGGNMAWGFGGVTHVYPNFSTPGNAAVGQAGHPIFNGPFLPAGVAYTGTWWSHSIVTGGGITDIISGTGGSTLAELVWGAGRVMFGGMTSWGWHSPTPNSQNLVQNIFYYLNCIPIILPAELTTYDLNYDGEVCKLNWKTASEKNTDYFVIEKSLDGSNYTVLDKLPAAGNSNQAIEYSTSDREPNKNGLTYYRLKQYDRGNLESKLNLVKTLNLKEIKKDYLKVQPNPANASMDVFLPETFVAVNKTLNVFDLSGTKVLTIQLGNTSSQTSYRLNIETLKTGMYSLQIVNEEGTSVKTTFIKN